VNGFVQPQLGYFAGPGALFWATFGAAFVFGVCWLATWSMRHRERAMCLIRAIEAATRQGRNLGHAFEELGARGDAEFGWRLQAAADRMRGGTSLSAALGEVGFLLPPRAVRILAAGEASGDIRRALPICRQALHDVDSRGRTLQSFIVALLSGGLFTLPAVFGVIAGYVLPQFEKMMSEMGIHPATSAPVFWIWHPLFPLVGVLIAFAVIWCVFFGLDWLRYLGIPLPWLRTRQRRDFAGVLAMMLDAGAPEDQAILAAAQSVGRRRVERWGERAASAVRAGTPLPQALQTVDPAGELRWRMENAARGDRRFVDALRGWQRALDARADRYEEAAVHVVSTGLVVLSGTMVGFICIGIFGLLLSIVREASPW
jgi:type II secretory pathway component PulF